MHSGNNRLQIELFSHIRIENILLSFTKGDTYVLFFLLKLPPSIDYEYDDFTKAAFLYVQCFRPTHSNCTLGLNLNLNLNYITCIMNQGPRVLSLFEICY